VSPGLPKVTLRLPDKAGEPGDTAEAQQKCKGKQKYVEISTLTAKEDESDVKEEEMDILMVSCLMRCFPTFCRIEPQTCNISRNQKYSM